MEFLHPPAFGTADRVGCSRFCLQLGCFREDALVCPAERSGLSQVTFCVCVHCNQLECTIHFELSVNVERVGGTGTKREVIDLCITLIYTRTRLLAMLLKYIHNKNN